MFSTKAVILRYVFRYSNKVRGLATDVAEKRSLVQLQKKPRTKIKARI